MTVARLPVLISLALLFVGCDLPWDPTARRCSQRAHCPPDSICAGASSDAMGVCTPGPGTDGDRDGVAVEEGDCNDDDPSIYLGADEICDEKDNDCDPTTTAPGEGLDADGDGVTVCGGDCDDDDPTRFPKNPEVCDGRDNDCVNGADFSSLGTSELDLDGDGFLGCDDDCRDDDALTFPGAQEVCDLEDNDCDGERDEDFDVDGDGLMDVTNPQCAALYPVADCDDTQVQATNTAIDADCDDVLFVDDCDDGDSTLLAQSDDLDCDRVLNDADCDDAVDTAGDMDCDGVPAAEDCDDLDDQLLALANDADCDGALASDDCDDNDPAAMSQSLDFDCDGSMDCLGTSTFQGMEFVLVCDGTFEMGCTPAQQGDGNCSYIESPAHTVTLTHDIWVGATEVTQGQWQSLMGTNPAFHGPTGNGTCAGADCPVEQVNWYEALAYANAMSAAEGLPACFLLDGCTGTLGAGCPASAGGDCDGYACASVTVDSPTGTPYDCEGYRLPTEAEWEYAARAGTDLVYAGSNVAGDVAWYSANSWSSTQEVATKAANAWGLFDFSGNLDEWCQDAALQPYDVAPEVDPWVSSQTLNSRIMRGGGFYYQPYLLRVSSRSGLQRPVRLKSLGFRLVRTLP